MKLIPVRLEYCFEALKHKMRAAVKHMGGSREICYYFDDEMVSNRFIPNDLPMTDDDCICDLVHAYSQTHTNVFSDLFKKHRDKVLLKKKTVEVTLDNNGFLFDASVVIEKGFYTISISTNNGEDSFTSRFAASSFSEALEKIRIFLNTLEGVSDSLSKHISKLANDRVQELVEWR